MQDDNKRNLMFIENPSVRGLYEQLDEWQKANRKRLHSVQIQKDGDNFCCIALTNPTEVIITDESGCFHAEVNSIGELSVIIDD